MSVFTATAGVAAAQSSNVCVNVGTYDSESNGHPTTVLLEGTSVDFVDIAETSEPSNPDGCLREDLNHYYIYSAPTGEYTVHIRNDQSPVQERWGVFERTVDGNETFILDRMAPYHTDASVESPRGTTRFEPGETAQFSTRVYNPRESTSRDVTAEVYVYASGSSRPSTPTRRLSTVTVSGGQHETISAEITMPETEGEYVVDVELVTDFGFGEFTSDYVDLGTVTVDSFEPPSIDSASPEQGTINVGPEERQSFSVSISDPDSTPTVQWYVDGSRTTTGSSYAFDAAQYGAGEHTVRVVASDGSDMTADASTKWTVDVADAPEITSVQPGTTSVTVGRSVAFSVDTAATGHQHEWTIDGQTFSGNSVETTFTSTGEKPVEVAVTNDRGVTTTQSFVVTVEHAPPSLTDFSVAPSSVALGEAINFSANAADPAGRSTSFSYQWRVDGRTLSGSDVGTTFSRAGTYTVELVVTNDYGGTTTRTRTVTVERAPPSINGLSVSSSSVTVGESVQFLTSASDPAGRDTAFEYRWTIGNRTFTGTNVETTFASAGTYDIELTVTNDYGSTTTRTRTVTVEAAPPSITEMSVSPSSVTIGEQVSLSADALDPAGRKTGFAYRWQVGNRTFSGSSVEATFTEAGTYDVNLTVTNDFGETTSQTSTLAVEAAPPSITRMSVSPSSLIAGEQVSLSATATDPAQRGTAFTYEWSIGDQTFEGATAQTRLSTVDTHDVTLTVTNEYGTTTTRSQSITVANDDPRLERQSPDATPTPRAGSTQRFLVSVTDDDAAPATVSWTVDGQQVASQTVTADERRLAFTRRFTDPGTHTVEVTVEDGHGARTALDWTVAVQNRPPRIESAGPASSSFSVMSGTTRTFNVTATDPDGKPVSYRWFVDGEQQSTGLQYTHTFEEAGTHNVTVVATDSHGDVARQRWSVAVRNFRRVPEIDTSASITTLRPENETKFIALSFRNPGVNNRTARVELALSVPNGVTVSATRNVGSGSQPEYVSEATVAPGQQTSISLAITVQDPALAGQRIDVPYQVIYYPDGQRDSYRVVENATKTIRIVGTGTATTSVGTGDGSSGGSDGQGTNGGGPDPTTGSGPGFTAVTALLALCLWLGVGRP